MELIFTSLESVIGTPFYDIHYKLRDGSVLRASGFVSIRQEWFNKPISSMTKDELLVIVTQQLSDSLSKVVLVQLKNFCDHPQSFLEFQFDRDQHASIQPQWYTIETILTKLDKIGHLPKEWMTMNAYQIVEIFEEFYHKYYL